LAKDARDNAEQAATASQGEKQGALGDAQAALSQAQADLKDTTEALEADTENLATTTKGCNIKKSEWAERTALREKDAKAYAAEKAEADGNIAAIESAVTALEKGAAGGFL